MHFRYLIAALTGGLAFTVLAAGEPNTLTDAEKANGWRLLFDGTSTAGWRTYARRPVNTNVWVIVDGWLKKTGGVSGGDIVTEAEFTDFELEWEWRIPAKANNGVKYFITDQRKAAVGHEYQMIDDTLVKNPKYQTASFYDVLPPERSVPAKFFPESNHSRIVVKGNHVEHWLNGVQVLAYECGSPEVMAAVGRSKFKKDPTFGTKVTGRILLTDHKDEAWFRNVKLRPLAP